MIKNILLDIGNVLAEFRWRGLMEDLGFSEDTIIALRNNVIRSPLWKELDRGVMDIYSVVDLFKQHNPEYAKEIEAFFHNAEGLVEQFEYTEDFVKELKAKGYKVYILSNYPGHIFSIHEKKFTFLPHVDGKVISGYVKMIKPEPEIYHYLLDTYGLKPEECVFIDDLKENIHSAVSLGIAGIVFTSYEQVREELDKLLMG